ncbi:MAG: protein translocase subunit SecF [Hahellaceae bacterium]|nr:protein translocase subunit SecF [Hahellaceae bacterium]
MMENRVINFMGIAKPTALLSLLMVLASIVALAVKGLTLGLDFTGGTSLELEFSAAPEIREVRETLASNGFDKAVIQTFGADTAVLVRLQQELTDTLGQDVVNALSGLDSKVKLTKADYVGSQVGEELREDGGLGLLLALLTIMVYVAMRFQFKFSVGAVVALFHDVTITLGVFSILGWEFDLNVLAAILALIGYSLNDTIVVFDRIRENFRKLRKETPVSIVNISLTDTLSRTIMTGVTTLLVVVALYLFGGEALVGFSKALIIGILIGTYSSVYIASNLALMMNVTSEDLMEPVKEGAQVDDRP